MQSAAVLGVAHRRPRALSRHRRQARPQSGRHGRSRPSADVILRVIDPSKLQVVAAVADPDLARVQVGKPVRVIVPGIEEPEAGKVLTRPAAVDPSGVSADVRIAFNTRTRLAGRHAGARRNRRRSNIANALAVPVDAVLHEDEDALRHGGWCRQQGAQAQSHARADHAEAGRDHRAASSRARTSSSQGQQGLPDGADIATGEMSLAGARRTLRPRHPHGNGHSRGGRAADGVPAAERHLSAARCFRASSSSATAARCPARTMMLTVTRPIEQALLEVPGIRRVRSTTFRGATEISAQFDPATDMVAGAAAGAGPGRRDPRRRCRRIWS